MGFAGLPVAFGVPRRSRISRAFAEAVSRLELNPDRVAEASQHYGGIKEFIESALPGVRVTQVGSFQRQTKIRPVSSHRLRNLLIDAEITPIDLDILVSFGPVTRWVNDGSASGPEDLLRVLYAAVRSSKRYQVLEPTIDSPVITMSYSNEFSMELIPCTVDQVSSLPPRICRPYLVPYSGGWKWADYDYDAELITRCNKQSGGKLIPSIKLCKGFVRNHGLPFKSFHVEILCVAVFDRLMQAYRYHWSYEEFFVEFLKLLPVALFEPAKLAGSYSDEQMVAGQDASQSFLLVMKIAEAAGSLLVLPDTENTVSLWSQFYGYPFPSSTLWLS